MATLTYKDLIEKIGSVANNSGLLLRVHGELIHIEGKYFHFTILNKLQRLLQLYGECEWWITPSENISDGVMYKIKVFQYK